ncbi:uncharacterized protein Z519_05749 [Cladophialophora bantiana CBS 173.52]|uniref:Uncharacterized protein n=1 Tax=Cladophialophora bantiana (strain ATCC 10958 / CBS 173.52 / CDC B-1940 / NIH 8579) TaxID=1442370 RepID=A0A0D2I8L0_CLAB1|nr:uncharacterized protein Z519_05749 [Cladophialophora bantiana CBS 173.52]KIW93144.1 hypothetical protein Z519_05749 [Cladophialophora bantiana CBS 173.52]
MLQQDSSGAVDPEDRKIIEQLAKLQDMYSQIGDLRSLLPEKLINPARVALDNPGDYEPEKLAAYLQTAALAGSRDLERFKKDWHSDDVRELWQTVNASDFPQGGDAWAFDYARLLRDAAANEETSISTGKEASHDFQPQSDAEIAKTVDDFRARHPELKIHVSEEVSLLPIEIGVSRFDFRIEKKSSSGGTTYDVIDKSGAAASAVYDMSTDVLQSIRESKERDRLETLLEMIHSYHDITTRPCDKCGKLFDTKKLKLPVIRQVNPSTQGEQHPQFLALHRVCV